MINVDKLRGLSRELPTHPLHPTAAPFRICLGDTWFACATNGHCLLAIESEDPLRLLETEADRLGICALLDSTTGPASTIRTQVRQLNVERLCKWVDTLLLARQAACTECQGNGLVACECYCGHEHRRDCECVTERYLARIGLAGFNLLQLGWFLDAIPETDCAAILISRAAAPDTVGYGRPAADHRSVLLGKGWRLVFMPVVESCLDNTIPTFEDHFEPVIA